MAETKPGPIGAFTATIGTKGGVASLFLVLDIVQTIGVKNVAILFQQEA